MYLLQNFHIQKSEEFETPDPIPIKRKKIDESNNSIIINTPNDHKQEDTHNIEDSPYIPMSNLPQVCILLGIF